MAITNSDGSIVLTTIVDPSGIKSFQSSLKKLAGSLAAAFSINQIVKFSNAAGQLATQTEASVQRLVDIYGSASDSVGDFIDANARALGMSKAAAASFSSVYGNLFSVWADQATNAELTNRYLNMTAVVASKTGRTVEDVQERVRSGLLGNTEAIEDLGIFVNVKTIEMTDAFQRMASGKSWEQLDAYTQQQIRSMAILEQATAKYGDEVADTSATIRNRYKAAYEDFQNSWGNIVNTVLLPVLETLTQIFDIAAKGLNALSGRSGQILENVELQEENTDKTAENIKKQTENQKELNDELKKSTASFDTVQILSSKTADNTSGTLGGGLQGIGNDLGGTAPDGSAYVEEINATLAAIMQTVAVSMIAIGLILLFTGHAGWGIGAIIFGLGLEGVTVASITQSDPTQQIATSLLFLQGIAVGASVALGVMMIYMGSKGLGIGLIAYGALQLGVTIYEITQFSTSPIENIINTIQGIAAGAMLALGFFLLYFKVNMPLAISLIAGGALLLVDEISDIAKNGMSPEISAWINAIMLILEGAALVIGIILLVTSVNIPLGISLTATGAFAIGKEIAVNWDTLKKKIKQTFEDIIDWVKSYGMLVLGILLCLTGAGIPIGIALILKWVKEDGENGYPLTNAAVDAIEDAWKAIKNFWNQHIAKVFTWKWWNELGKDAFGGFVEAAEWAMQEVGGLLGGLLGINFSQKGIANKISESIVGNKNGNVSENDIMDAIRKALKSKIRVPFLAQGGVIPPNREFLAVLGDQKQGTNIEAPLQTIVDAFNIALAQNGGAVGGNTEVVLEIDGREFGRAVVEQGNKENRRIGTRLVIA